MAPFLLGALIRFGITDQITWATFSATDLLISLALLALFVSQSILHADLNLPNPEDEQDRRTLATLYFWGAALCFILFGVEVALASIIQSGQATKLERALHFFEAISFLLPLLFVPGAIVTQRSYKLRASI